MRRKPNVWERNLSEGERAQKIANQRLQDWLLGIRIKDYSQNIEKQKQGVDIEIDWERANVDTKARDFNTRRFMLPGGDICIETESVREVSKLGWYYTSKADFIAYVWWNTKKTDLYEGYLIALQDPRFRNWFEQNIEKFEEKESETVAEGGRKWHTRWRVVPVSEFPEGTLFKFIEPPGKGWGPHGNKRLNNYMEK